jgi:hypothetical protein
MLEGGICSTLREVTAMLTRIKATSLLTPFYTRHSRLISVLGPFVLLLTFLVQEIFQNQLKGIRDAMIEAQHVESLADESTTSSQQQVALNMRLRQIRTFVGPQSSKYANSANDMQEEVADLLQIYSAEVQHFDRLSDMLDGFPGRTEALKKQRDDFRAQLANLGVEVKKRAAESLAVKEPTAIHHVLIITELLEVEAFGLDLIPLEEAVVGSAKNVRAAAVKLDHECTYTIWCFYGIGWVLSFGGVISGWEAKKGKQYPPARNLPVTHSERRRSVRHPNQR